MIQNTVQTLVDYVKDLSGQTNAPIAKIIRALNFGTDHLSVIKLMAASKTNPDSSNQSDLSRSNVTTSAVILNLVGGTLDNGEVMTFRHVEIVNGDGYERLYPIDSRDAEYEYLQNSTGTPTHFDIEGNILRLFPKPDQSFTYRLSYGRVHPRFSADNLTQSTGLLPNEEEYVAMYAADKIMIGTNDPTRAGIRNDMVIKQREIEKMTGLRDQTKSRRIKPKASTMTRNDFTKQFNQGV